MGGKDIMEKTLEAYNDVFAHRRTEPDYRPSKPRDFEHIDEVLKLLSVMADDDRYVNVEVELVERWFKEGREYPSPTTWNTEIMQERKDARCCRQQADRE